MFGFEHALSLLKEGNFVQREGWNDKGMYIFMVKEQWKTVKEEHTISKMLPVGSKIKVTAHMCMKAADGTLVKGWLASQTDLVAEDWQLIT